MITLFRRAVQVAALVGLSAQPSWSQGTLLELPPDSPKWALQGRARPDTLGGRACLRIDGGGAGIRDFRMQDGIVDVEVFTPATRGFFGIEFRSDSANSEFVYLRQHKSGQPDAMQYTPVLNTGLNWQLYSGPGFTGRVNVPRDVWFHLRLEVRGAQARLFVGDTLTPALVMDDLKSNVRNGEVGLAVLTGATCFADFRVRSLAASPWQRHLPPMPPGTLVSWEISPALDAVGRDLERSLPESEARSMAWQSVEAEAPGIVALNRYRPSPHPVVTFQSDFATRLQPQPGTSVVYARTHISADRAEVRKLQLGYSDEVSVFLNGRILYRGRSAQSFRDPGFLGIVDAENDAIYLPLQAGDNELVLAVSELGGGWGFVARLAGSPAR